MKLNAVPATRLLVAAALISVASAMVAVLPGSAVAQRYDEQRYEDDEQHYEDDDDRRDEDDRRDRYDDAEREEVGDLDTRDEVDVETFYDELDDHGRWIRHPRYGYVWSPDLDDDDWRPYSRGRWVWTDEHGWYWESEEPFGWAVYHYGRWALDDEFGWVWVPGRRWGPAWVAWRRNDDYVGWAPLPPEAEWVPRRGLVYEARLFEDERYFGHWSFVSYRYVTAPRVWRHCAPRRNVVDIVFRTRPATIYSTRDRRIFNRSLDPRLVARFTGNPVRPVRLRSVEDKRRSWTGHGGDGRPSTIVNVFKPKHRERREVAPSATIVAPRKLVAPAEIVNLRRPGVGDGGRGRGEGGPPSTITTPVRGSPDQGPATTPSGRPPAEIVNPGRNSGDPRRRGPLDSGADRGPPRDKPTPLADPGKGRPAEIVNPGRDSGDPRRRGPHDSGADRGPPRDVSAPPIKPPAGQVRAPGAATGGPGFGNEGPPRAVRSQPLPPPDSGRARPAESSQRPGRAEQAGGGAGPAVGAASGGGGGRGGPPPEARKPAQGQPPQQGGEDQKPKLFGR